MTDRARDFVDDLRANWDNAYWWADHPTLRTVLVCAVAGLAGLVAEYAKLRMQRNMIGATP